MRSLSPERRRSLTHRTMYASLCKERPPGELDTTATANNRVADQDLDKNHRTLNSMRRKSIGHINAQRKLLEKSMLAYSEKMKEISNERTSDLFREIHTRNSTRQNRGTKSLTLSVDSEETEEAESNNESHKIPKIRRQAGQVTRERTPARKTSIEDVQFNQLRKLLSRSNTIVPIALSPLQEEDSTLTRDGLQSTASQSSVRTCRKSINSYNKSGTPLSSASTETILMAPRIHISSSIKTSHDTNEDSAHDDITRDQEGSDSAYSSCGEDETDVGDDNVDPQLHKNGFLLTVPRVHMRRKHVRKLADSNSDSLHKKAILNNITQSV